MSQSVSLTHLLAWRTGPHAHTRCTRLAREPTRGALSPAVAPGGSGLLDTQHTAHRTAHEAALYSGVLMGLMREKKVEHRDGNTELSN